MNQLNTDALLESPALRESVISRTDVLDKVKKLMLLPDDIHVTVEMVATYFEVEKQTIHNLIFDHRKELDSDGLEVLKGEKLVVFSKKVANISNKTRSLTLIPRRAILRIGMLLRDSEVAQKVRSYLLDVEQVTRTDRALAAKRVETEWMKAKTELAKTMMEFLNKPCPATAETMMEPKKMDSRPQEEKRYSATDIAEMTGVCRQMVGKIAKGAGLRAEEYCKTIKGKSKRTGREIEVFLYNERAKDILLELLEKKTVKSL